MIRDTTTMSPRERQDHLLQVISSERFLKKQGLGNEVPFFICPYPAADAVDMEAVREQVIKQLANRGVTALDEQHHRGVERRFGVELTRAAAAFLQIERIGHDCAFRK